jgi:hypothetical protein
VLKLHMLSSVCFSAPILAGNDDPSRCFRLESRDRIFVMNSFAVLQQFSAAITHVALSEAMDLCALVTEESLSIHRTISW